MIDREYVEYLRYTLTRAILAGSPSCEVKRLEARLARELSRGAR